MTDIALNTAAQRELYGAPLGELCHEVMVALGMTQGRLAEVLGISAPMLSQLMSGRRVKIGNPAAVHRLQALLELAPQAQALGAPELAARVEAVRGEAPTLTTTRVAETLTGQLRAVADPAQLRAAAAAVPGTALGALLEQAADG